MRRLLLLTCLLIYIMSPAQKVELSVAKFSTGDTIAYRYPAFDDSQWQDMKANTPWDYQGYPNYDGFAWYRFHLLIPSSLREGSLWKDSLRVFLSKIDDACEVYLNGVRIGKSGSFPNDKEGYITTWDKKQEYHIAANSSCIYWNGMNILAVRVYDGGGQGGIYGGIPYVNMVDLVDGLDINTSVPVQFISDTKAKKSITLHNTFNQKISGKLDFDIIDVTNNDTIRNSHPVDLAPNGIEQFSFSVPLSERNDILYTFIEINSHKTIQTTEIIPYLLTPRSPELPRINGAKVFGVRAGSPFLFKIPATGKHPLQFSVENLPEGLNVNGENGVISGTIPKKGDYKMIFRVKNTLGESTREFTVKCGDLLALTPPMGWNSWNCWGLSVSDEKLKASAKAMMDMGLIDHGWTFMNIDDGWEAETRKDNGEIVANKKFPDMRKLGDWLHGNGLKFGIYSSPGPKTCGGYLGSYKHEKQDAATYASWGIDYLKYDWCSYGEIHDKNDSTLESYKKPYTVMRDALLKQNRDIHYSLCQYGMKNVWEWGATVNGNCWRTTGDIEDTWESLKEIGFSQTIQNKFAGPGRWNDPDMMIVGQVGWGDHLHPTRLTPDEQYTHVSLWSMLSAPLLIGCDLAKLDDFTLNLLTNDEVIAVDQDPLGKQAHQALKTDSYQVWMKDLEDGSMAMGIFNLSDKDDVIRFYWNNLGLGENFTVRDLWRQKDLGFFKSMFATRVAAHGVTLIRVTPKK